MLYHKDGCISFGIRKRTCALEEKEKDKEKLVQRVKRKKERVNGDEATESKQGEVIRHSCVHTCTHIHTMDPESAGRLGDGRGRRSGPTEAQSTRPPNTPLSHREDNSRRSLGVLFLIIYCVQAPRVRLGLQPGPLEPTAILSSNQG